MQHAILLLPASAAAPGPAMLPAEETGADGRIAAPVRVLLVEDEILTALDIEYLVQQLGYEVCGIAASAPEAVQAADDLRPDLVLMDIRLARGTDGIQAAGEIRTRFDIASLYLSAHTDAATLNRAQATQPLGFIAKPYTQAQLEAALRAAVAVLRAVQSNSSHRTERILSCGSSLPDAAQRSVHLIDTTPSGSEPEPDLNSVRCSTLTAQHWALPRRCTALASVSSVRGDARCASCCARTTASNACLASWIVRSRRARSSGSACRASSTSWSRWTHRMSALSAMHRITA
jgi:DNA-binding NarL/FixJ family response regulator